MTVTGCKVLRGQLPERLQLARVEFLNDNTLDGARAYCVWARDLTKSSEDLKGCPTQQLRELLTRTVSLYPHERPQDVDEILQSPALVPTVQKVRAIIEAQTPKLQQQQEAIKADIADLLGDPDHVNTAIRQLRDLIRCQKQQQAQQQAQQLAQQQQQLQQMQQQAQQQAQQQQCKSPQQQHVAPPQLLKHNIVLQYTNPQLYQQRCMQHSSWQQQQQLNWQHQQHLQQHHQQQQQLNLQEQCLKLQSSVTPVQLPAAAPDSTCGSTQSSAAVSPPHNTPQVWRISPAPAPASPPLVTPVPPGWAYHNHQRQQQQHSQ
jgi:hypothetical protein